MLFRWILISLYLIVIYLKLENICVFSKWVAGARVRGRRSVFADSKDYRRLPTRSPKSGWRWRQWFDKLTGKSDRGGGGQNSRRGLGYLSVPARRIFLQKGGRYYIANFFCKKGWFARKRFGEWREVRCIKSEAKRASRRKNAKIGVVAYWMIEGFPLSQKNNIPPPRAKLWKFLKKTIPPPSARKNGGN